MHLFVLFSCLCASKFLNVEILALLALEFLFELHETLLSAGPLEPYLPFGLGGLVDRIERCRQLLADFRFHLPPSGPEFFLLFRQPLPLVVVAHNRDGALRDLIMMFQKFFSMILSLSKLVNRLLRVQRHF